jgi:hypothetical protein
MYFSATHLSPVYDVLMDEFEKGMTTEPLEEVFTKVRTRGVWSVINCQSGTGHTHPFLTPCWPHYKDNSSLGLLRHELLEMGMMGLRLEEDFT